MITFIVLHEASSYYHLSSPCITMSMSYEPETPLQIQLKRCHRVGLTSLWPKTSMNALRRCLRRPKRTLHDALAVVRESIRGSDSHLKSCVIGPRTMFATCIANRGQIQTGHPILSRAQQDLRAPRISRLYRTIHPSFPSPNPSWAPYLRRA